MIYDQPKPTKRKHPVVQRISHLKTTIPALILIGTAVLISRIQMDETVKNAIVLPLIGLGLAGLGMKGKTK